MTTPDRAPSARPAPVQEEFSLPLFLFTIAASLAGLAGLVWLLAPDAVWAAQVGAAWWKYLLLFPLFKLGTCFLEFFFHRYVLHKPVLPFLSYFYRQHTHHHNLTRIGSRRTPSGRELLCVENKYPIVEDEQKEASFFPWYTTGIFAAIFTPALMLLQWLAPSWPWFLCGYGALAAAITLYEIFHAIEHWPFEKWVPFVESRRFGWLGRRVYGFHLRHHAAIHSNEAISGFFTLPIADWCFGTAVFPRSLYKDGEAWCAEHFTTPRPVFLIRWLDQWTDAWVQWRRRRAAQPA